MKKFLITHNVCGEIRRDVVEVNFDTLDEFANWIIESMGVHFILLTVVSEDTKVEIVIKPQNIEAIMELSDK